MENDFEKKIEDKERKKKKQQKHKTKITHTTVFQPHRDPLL